MHCSLLLPLDSDTRRRVALDPFAGPGLRFLVVYVQILSLSMHREHVGFWRLPERSAGDIGSLGVILGTHLVFLLCHSHRQSSDLGLRRAAMKGINAHQTRIADSFAVRG